MAVETVPTRDPFALSEEERTVRDTVREWAHREVAPGAAQRDGVDLRCSRARRRNRDGVRRIWSVTRVVARDMLTSRLGEMGR